MGAGPAVSVILPTYNRASLLPRAIASVLGQTFRDFELLVIDDGSTDHSLEVVQSFGDERIRVIATAGRIGSAGARNVGIAQARGAWLAFQDSDDEWLCDKLARQFAFAESLPQDYALIGCRLLRHTPVDVESLQWPRLQPAAGDCGEVDRQQFVRSMTAYLQSLLIRRSAFEAVGGFDATLRKSSDLDLCLRLARQYRFATIDQVLALSFETPGSVSQHAGNAVIAWRHILQSHRDLIEADSVAAARYWTELGCCELSLNHRSAAAGALWKGICVRPANPRAWFWLGLLPFGKAGVEGRQRLRQRAQARRRA